MQGHGASADQRRRLLDVLISTLDEPISGAEIARRARLGRFYFSHLVKETLGESPAAFRRRLLLERAAYELSTTEESVLMIGLRGGYASPEAFAHAFHRAFGSSPRSFRASRSDGYSIAAPNGVHFHPPGGPRLPGTEKRRRAMDLTDRMVEHDNWLTEQLLECARGLSEEELDEPVVLNPPSTAFAERAPSIRAMLDRLVLTKEMWTMSITGRGQQLSDDTTIDGMLERLERAAASFAEIVRDIRMRDAWDTAFVDATSTPPRTNTFGAAISHVLAWDAARREIVAGSLHAKGIDPVSLDPITWEHHAHDERDVAVRL